MLKNITLVALHLLLVFGVYVFIEYPELRAYVLLMQTVIAIVLLRLVGDGDKSLPCESPLIIKGVKNV
jgi:hypothetical protein